MEQGCLFEFSVTNKHSKNCTHTPPNLYKEYQIPKLKCISSRLAFVFPNPLKQSVKSRMKMLLDRRCSNYIWVVNNFIAYEGTAYIRGLSVARTTYLHILCIEISGCAYGPHREHVIRKHSNQDEGIVVSVLLLYLLSKKWLMYGIPLPHSTASRRCFWPRMFLCEKRIGQVAMDLLYILSAY